MRDTPITKLGWRTLTEPNALWARVLQLKYCKARYDMNMFNPKVGMSNVWKGITDNAQVQCEGMRTSVGDRKKTLFWDHKWVSNTPLSNSRFIQFLRSSRMLP